MSTVYIIMNYHIINAWCILSRSVNIKSGLCHNRAAPYHLLYFSVQVWKLATVPLHYGQTHICDAENFISLPFCFHSGNIESASSKKLM